MFKIINFLDHSYSRNVAFTFLMGVFCVFLGSTSTALLLMACVTIIFFNIKIPMKEIWRDTFLLFKQVPLMAVFPLFYVVVVLTSLRGENWLNSSVVVAGSYWQFLVMVPASVGLYHLSKNVNFAGLFSYGCRFGLMFVVPLSLIQIYFLNLRPEGVFSNSLVFASLCIVGAGIALIEWPEDTKKTRALSLVLFAMGLFAAILTFSRGMLIPIASVLAIAIFYRIKVSSEYKFDLKITVLLAVVFAGLFFSAVQTDNGWRILNKRVLQPIEMLSQSGTVDRSVSQRLNMQMTGFRAFMDSPFTGYGVQNAVSQANAVSLEVLGIKTEYTYTHLHNDYLTHAVGGGILLLILFITVIFSPVILAWKLRKTYSGTGLLYYGAMVSGAFSTIAMTNIVFHNDQLTTMFCVSVMFIIVRYVQIAQGEEVVTIPHLPTIANGINPIGIKPEDAPLKTISN